MKKLLTILKYLCIIFAYAFIIYKAFFFHDYIELFHGLTTFSIYLLFIILLLPLNILLEAFKWKTLIKSIHVISIPEAIKSVLIGIVGGLSTPNKIGDFPVRTLYMPAHTRVPATIIGYIGSWIQTIVIALTGIISLALLIKHNNFQMQHSNTYTHIVLVVIIILFITFCTLPLIAQRLNNTNNTPSWLKTIIRAISELTLKQFHKLILITLARYIVFSFQFFLALKLFGIDLSLSQAFLSIPSMYLLISITPSFAISDLIVRTSYASLIIGLFSTNILAISLASSSIWTINCLVPMIIGSILMCSNKIKA